MATNTLPEPATVAAQFHHIPAIGAGLFEVRAGIDKEIAEQHADLCLHLAGELLCDIVAEPVESNIMAADRAYIARLLVEQARACYVAAGASS